MHITDIPLVTSAMPKMPKYRQIATVIEEYLVRTHPAPGEKFFTDRALAKYFSTTVVTVAHSLNYLCQKGLLVRRVGAGTYIAGNAVKRIKSRIGIICHEMILEEGYYVSPVLSRFGAFFNERNYDVISFKASPEEYRHLIDEYELAGIMIFCPRPEFAEILTKLRSEGVPVISVGYAMPELRGVAFGTDHAEMIRNAVEHLYKLGHRKIALLHSMRHSCSDIFTRAYLQAMWQYQLPVNPDWNMGASGWTAGETLNTLIKQNNMPTAIIAGQTSAVAYVYNLCQQNGIRIPDDLSLLALGDSEIFTQLHPPVSVIAQNLPEIADRAANALLNMIQLKSIPEDTESAVMPIPLERKSCKSIQQ